MGLDQYAYYIESKDVVSDFEFEKGVEPVEFFYWRKHHALHRWMQELYAKKAGYTFQEMFNCVPLKLTEKDLDDLSQELESLCENHLFFTEEECFKNDLEFVKQARKFINQGFAVYYDSWW